MNYFRYIVIALVIAAVAVGLWFSGSPRLVRLQKIDQVRVNDLQSIQSSLFSYWDIKKELPQALEAIQAWQGYGLPLDPESRQLYEYQKTGDFQFKLCADFALESPSDEMDKRYTAYAPYPVSPKVRSLGEWTWEHPAGKHCFDRTFEPLKDSGIAPVPADSQM